MTLVKPVVPSWATAGIVTEPTAAKKLVGWTAGERPPGQFMNWLASLYTAWFSFLDGIFASDGSITVPNATVTSDLTVDGDGHVLGNLEVDGTLTLPAVITPLPTALSLDNFATGGGTTHSRVASHWVFAASSTAIYYPILLGADRRITGYGWTLTHNSGGTTNAHLVDISPTGAETTHGSGSSGSSTSSFGESGLSVDVASFTSLWIKIVPPGSVTPGADDLNLVTVTSIAKP